MKFALFFGLIFFSISFSTNAQTPGPKTDSQKPKETVEKPEAVKNSSAPAQQATYVRPSAKKRFKSYVSGIFGPIALARNAASAGISTWKNSPVEWGDRWPGFGRRFASGVGKSFIHGTVSYGLEEAFKLDSRYYRSGKKDFGSRASNALLSTVTARDKNGKRVFGFPRIAGTYTASIVAAEAWYPARFNYKDGLRNGTISLGFNAVFNLIKEFMLKKK